MMNKESYLKDLITRMLDDTPYTNSAHAISFKATREAEELRDHELLDIAISRISTEKNKKVRSELYYVISKISLNIKNVEGVQFLIDRLEYEADKYVLSSMLDRIAELPKTHNTNLEPIINHTKDKRWLVRHSAIMALTGAKNEVAEERLINILERSEDPYDVTYANSVLMEIGTSASIPAIERHLKSRKLDVKMSSKMALESVKKRMA